MRSLVAILAVMAGLTACSSGTPTASSPAESPTPSVQDSASPTNPTTSAPAEPSASPSSALTSKIKQFGPGSPQCAAISRILMQSSRIGMLANQGQVSAADINQAFGDTKGVPPAAMPIVQDIKAVSEKLVGKDAQQATAFLGEFSTALGTLTAAAERICS